MEQKIKLSEVKVGETFTFTYGPPAFKWEKVNATPKYQIRLLGRGDTYHQADADVFVDRPKLVDISSVKPGQKFKLNGGITYTKVRSPASHTSGYGVDDTHNLAVFVSFTEVELIEG